MHISNICPVNWLKVGLAWPLYWSSSSHLRRSRGTLGFGGAQSFFIHNNAQYQWEWKVPYSSFNVTSVSISCALPAHAPIIGETPPLVYPIMYQLKGYSAVCKGQTSAINSALVHGKRQNSSEASFHSEEPLENPSKSRRSRSKGVLEASFPLKEPLEKPSISRKTRGKVCPTDSKKDSLEPSFLLEETLEKTYNSRKTRRKVGLTDPDREWLEASFLLEKPVGKLSKSRRKTSNTGPLYTKKESLEISSPSVEPLQKPSKSRRTRMKAGPIDPSKELRDKPSESRRTRSKFVSTTPMKDLHEDSSLLEGSVGKAPKSRKSKNNFGVKDSKELLEASIPLEEPLENLSRSGRTSSMVGLIDPNKVYQLEFDGACKGNPGKAGAGAVLRNQDGLVICELKGGVGRATCNVAEYRAIILGLKVALSKGIERIHVRGDSKLVCMQIQGLWKTKSENIAAISKEAKEIKDKFKEFCISHILRKFNAEADALANAAVELKNGEISETDASFSSKKPPEKSCNTKGTRKKVFITGLDKEFLEASLPLEKPLKKASNSGGTSSKDGLLNPNKVFYMLEFDGASKGNPGKAGAGAVLRNQDGSVICRLKEGVGMATNNVAEYRAVIRGLKVALNKGIQRIHVQGDSKLVCMQIQDSWKTKSQNLVALNMEAKELISKFKEFHISHIYREFNVEADGLANAAITLKSGEWTSNEVGGEGHVSLGMGSVIKAN